MVLCGMSWSYSDLEAEPHILDLKRERERERESD